MKLKKIALGACLSFLAFIPVGCGGDDDDDGGNTGGTSGNPDEGEGGADSGNVGCDPSVEGVCQNETDCPKVVTGEARMEAGTCGQGCIGSDDENCAVDCIVEKTDMTAECSKCYADTVNCTATKCLSDCIADTESDACKTCQVEEGCRDSFNECSGLPPG